ncbi:hemicentin-2 isoform X2 [Patella vulgata]|uniref:hemicentin-2 isoform X2 n=1 Tax=Patella vulgata TaxID=6465 RepID=UPI00217F4B1A|nr:hemicentin-2 isoform X2 [Patella vulgata]
MTTIMDILIFPASRLSILGIMCLLTHVITENEDQFTNRSFNNPVFLPSVTNITVKRGSLAVLPCSIQYLQDKQVVWRFVDEDKFLTIGKKTWFKSDKIILEHLSQDDNITNWDLLIKNTEFINGGMYECQITSTVDLTRRVQLNILETTIKGDRAIDRGERIYFVCNVTGGPHIPTDITWYKDGHPITSRGFPHAIITKYRSKVNNSSITEFIVDRSVFSDTGVYTCKSKTVDTVKAKIFLQIGDTVHVKRMFEDLKEEKRGGYSPAYTSGSLQTPNSCNKLSVSVVIRLLLIIIITTIHR